MGLILDSSVLIAAERLVLPIEPFLESLGDEELAIASITAAELLHGCHRAPDPGVRARRSAFVEGILGIMPIVPFGLGEARRHAELWAQLLEDGTPIGPHDLIVAATGLALGFGVATLNAREFSRVPGLRVIDPQR